MCGKEVNGFFKKCQMRDKILSVRAEGKVSGWGYRVEAELEVAETKLLRCPLGVTGMDRIAGDSTH